jgi:hypothetical protein
MERSRTDIDEYVRRLDRRRLDSVQATEVARDLKALAWREMILRPAGRALLALWRGLTAHAEPEPRPQPDRIAP